jgi:hypothetical protein
MRAVLGKRLRRDQRITTRNVPCNNALYRLTDQIYNQAIRHDRVLPLTAATTRMLLVTESVDLLFLVPRVLPVDCVGL